MRERRERGGEARDKERERRERETEREREKRGEREKSEERNILSMYDHVWLCTCSFVRVSKLQWSYCPYIAKI